MNTKFIVLIALIQIMYLPKGYVSQCSLLTPNNCGNSNQNQNQNQNQNRCNCQNGGSCASSNTCACPAGFTGQRCETQYFKCTTNGRFRDQFGCAQGKYLECVYVKDNQRVDPVGILYTRQCPNGLRFNPACDACDYAAFVNC